MVRLSTFHGAKLGFLVKMVKRYARISKLKMDVNVACANSVMCAPCVMKNIPNISTSVSKRNNKLSCLAHLTIKLINGETELKYDKDRLFTMNGLLNGF